MAGEDVDFDDAKPLMAAIDLLVANVASVGSPAEIRSAKINEANLGFLLNSFREVKPVQLMGGKLVPRKRVFAGVQLGASLVFSGGCSSLVSW